MGLQHYDNLFRRYKGRVIVLRRSRAVSMKAESQITNDYVELPETGTGNRHASLSFSMRSNRYWYQVGPASNESSGAS